MKPGDTKADARNVFTKAAVSYRCAAERKLTKSSSHRGDGDQASNIETDPDKIFGIFSCAVQK